MDYANFVKNCKIMDDFVNVGCVDRTFIATNSGGGQEKGKNDYNPGDKLCRFEFWEILCRLAQQKFMLRESTIHCTTFAEGLEKLLTEYILKNFTPDSWQDFRNKELWTIDVNDLYEANLENCRKVWTYYHTSVKKFMTLEDCRILCGKDSDFEISE